VFIEAGLALLDAPSLHSHQEEPVMKRALTKVLFGVLLCANAAFATQGIVTFVEQVTKESSPDVVPPAERIATVCDQRPIGRDAPPLYLYRV
jgi:hypothetical protein